jgi:hypothetical protein
METARKRAEQSAIVKETELPLKIVLSWALDLE